VAVSHDYGGGGHEQRRQFRFLSQASADRARAAHPHGDALPARSAWRYFEEIEPPAFGGEDDASRRAMLQLLQEETVLTARSG
jgi:hypothetical protein